MADKRVNTVRFRIDDNERAAVVAAAAAAGCTVSEYLRRAHVAASKPPATPPAPGQTRPSASSAPPLDSWHIDDLGDDPLRTDNGAMKR